MAEDMRPFEELVVGDHVAKALDGDEMIVDAVDLARSHRPGGGGNRHAEIGLVGEQLAGDRRFARARWRGKNEENTAAFETMGIVEMGGVHGCYWRGGGLRVNPL